MFSRSVSYFPRSLLVQYLNKCSKINYSARAGCGALKKRKFCVFGNFRMNGDRKTISDICFNLYNSTLSGQTEIVLGCPFPYITYAREFLPTTISLAGQNAYIAAEGEFTGEISSAMLKDVGAKWVIVGHSERRQMFNESAELIAKKCDYALAEGLKVIACVGDTFEVRECGLTNDFLAKQMCALKDCIENPKNAVLVYEPVWAIETGKSPTVAEIEEMHGFLRKWFAQNISEEESEKIRILYGGVVNAENCKELAKPSHVDGFLVGDASLKPEFVKIINCMERDVVQDSLDLC